MNQVSGQVIGNPDESVSARAAAARPMASRRAVRLWLWGLAALVMIMVAVGGATRLTGSGLSITEWKPVTGAIPPFSDAAWASEFEKYRASSQYQNLNRGMALDEFKTIYWWEWSHRQLGRFLGVYFFLPLLWFWWRGRVSTRLALGLVGIGALGGLQATVGWIMVASGLEPGMTAVAPLKLMLHLVLASLILALIVWVAAGLEPTQILSPVGRGEQARSAARVRGGDDSGEDNPPSSGRFAARPLSTGERILASADGPDASPHGDVRRGLARGAMALVLLILLQIALGGLVAGSRAGWTYNTWPLMDGRIVPEVSAMFSVKPWIENFVDNPVLVQFNHRMVAYLIVAAALWHAFAARAGAGAGRAGLIAGLTLAQAALGITTLLLVVPLWAGLSHQLLAMVLLMVAVHHARRMRVGG